MFSQLNTETSNLKSFKISTILKHCHDLIGKFQILTSCDRQQSDCRHPTTLYMLALKLRAQDLYEGQMSLMFRLRYLRCLLCMQICLNNNLNSETRLVPSLSGTGNRVN